MFRAHFWMSAWDAGRARVIHSPSEKTCIADKDEAFFPANTCALLRDVVIETVVRANSDGSSGKFAAHR
jgi:hypothetical protein